MGDVTKRERDEKEGKDSLNQDGEARWRGCVKGHGRSLLVRRTAVVNDAENMLLIDTRKIEPKALGPTLDVDALGQCNDRGWNLLHACSLLENLKGKGCDGKGDGASRRCGDFGSDIFVGEGCCINAVHLE